MDRDFAPSFRLAACPACSSLVDAVRPVWRLAKNVSITRGKKHWALVGCAHVATIAKPEKLFADPDEIALVEGAWKHAAEILFAEKTEGWSVLRVEQFRRELADENVLPGTTGNLRL
jgi:hypothetical protein